MHPTAISLGSLGSAGQPVNGSLRRQRLRLARARRVWPTLADRYTFTGAAGQLVALSLNSAAFDPYLYLIGPGSVVLAPS
ncbi:MAG: hypothetical protein ACREEM_54475 [Blastocatellia bacterium]